MGEYLMGIDLGGTTVKVALFTTKGQQISVASRVTETVSRSRGFVERNLQNTFQEIAECISEILLTSHVQPSEILAISSTGHGKGAYLQFQHEDEPSLGIVSSDNRASDLAQAINTSESYNHSILPLVMQPCWPAHTSSILSWLKKFEPERYASISHVLFAKDVISYFLTGVYTTDLTDATGSGLYDTAKGILSPEILDYFDLKELTSCLPQPLASHELVGKVSVKAAKSTGLLAGTPVFAGLFDVNASALATGILPNKEIALTLGTWNIATLLKTNQQHSEFDLKAVPVQRHVDLTQWMIHEGSPTSASNIEWFLQRLEGTDRSQKFQLIEKALADSRPSLVSFFPYVYGSFSHPKASGAFLGLTSDTSTTDMVKGVIDGINFQLYEHAQHILSQTQEISEFVVSGGPTKSRVWMERLAHLLGVPIRLCTVEEVGALGAAICARKGLEPESSYQTIQQEMISTGARIEPDESITPGYRKEYQQFLDLRKALGEVWSRKGEPIGT